MRLLHYRILAGAAALAGATAVGAPAHAAAAPKVAILVPPATVAAGFAARIEPIVSANPAFEVDNPQMTFELSGDLAGVTLYNAAPNDNLCTPDGQQKMTCHLPFPVGVRPAPGGSPIDASLHATKEAVGRTGTVKVTFSGTGVTAVSTTASVTVGEAVDLSAGTTARLTAGLGDDFEAAFQLRNNATVVAHGAAVTFETDYAFQPREKFSNCYYDGDRLTSCVFDQELAAGGSYSLRLPYRVRTDTQAPVEATSRAVWMTADDYADLTKFRSDHGLGGPGTPGTGAKLELTGQPAANAAVKAAVKQTDPHTGDDNDQFVYLSVTGHQGADLVAIGAAVDGAVGRTVPVTVGVRNDGPAAVDREHAVRSLGNPAAVAVFTPPAGTTVTRVPDGCRKAGARNEATKPGVTQYFCETAPLLLPNTRTTWTFQLKVTRAGAAGLIEVNPACECNRFTADTDKSNDTAAITVKTVAGGGTGSGSSSGSGGGLPITGPRSAAAGSAGAVLVLAGTAGFVLARRRRTRFEA